MDIVFKKLSDLIEVIIRKRNEIYEAGKHPVYRSKKFTISIGNLSFGGTGKTPLTIALARELIELGMRPGIIGSGYKRKNKDINVVCDGERILTDWQGAGDEMYLIAKKLNVPIVVHPKKFEAAKIIENFDIDVILLDDGFQHRELYRDVNLVIIDSFTIHNPKLPPVGELREPIDSLKRADLILTLEDINIPEKFLQYVKYDPIRFNIVSEEPYDLFTGEKLVIDSMKAVGFCGIHNPERFLFKLVTDLVDVVHFKEFHDHHAYRTADLQKLFKIAREKKVNTLMTTEKDAVKLEKYKDMFEENNMRLIVLPIELIITNGKNVLLEFITKKYELRKNE
jgi:tetraacyldisaccharide 4'-kinase